jgi:hypothetical protein
MDKYFHIIVLPIDKIIVDNNKQIELVDNTNRILFHLTIE